MTVSRRPGSSTLAICLTANDLPAPGGPKTAIDSGRSRRRAAQIVADVAGHDVAHRPHALDLAAIHRRPLADGLDGNARRHALGTGDGSLTRHVNEIPLPERLDEDARRGLQIAREARCGERGGPVAAKISGDGCEGKAKAPRAPSVFDSARAGRRASAVEGLVPVAVQGAHGVDAALNGRRDIGAPLHGLKQQRRAHARGVAENETGTRLLPVALLSVRIEHQREAATALDHDHACGSQIDRDAGRHDQLGRTDGSVDLVGHALPGQRGPHLHAALAQVLDRDHHRQAVGEVLAQPLPQGPVRQRRGHLEQDRHRRIRRVEQSRPHVLGRAEAQVGVVNAQEGRWQGVCRVDLLEIAAALRAALTPEADHAPRVWSLLDGCARVEGPRGPRPIQAVVGRGGKGLLWYYRTDHTVAGR